MNRLTDVLLTPYRGCRQISLNLSKTLPSFFLTFTNPPLLRLFTFDPSPGFGTTFLVTLPSLCAPIVLSRLDYCNPLLTGLPKWALRSLQLAQSTAARLEFKCRKSSYVACILQQHGWLPKDDNKTHCQKSLKLSFKSINDTGS